MLKRLSDIRVIHEGIKEHSCDICGFMTSRKRTLGKHMSTLHPYEYAVQESQLGNGYVKLEQNEQMHYTGKQWA